MGNGIVVIGATFVDIKGYPFGQYIPAGRNAGRVSEVHGGVCRNIAEDIANVGLRPTFLSVVDQSGTSTDVIDRLERHHCNTDYIRRTDDGLGTWLAVFDHAGDLVASISRRPNLDALKDVLEVNVIDTTGAGDSFFAGVAMGLTYDRTLAEACTIGTRLASSVVATEENVCPRFLPAEFDLEVPNGESSPSPHASHPAGDAP